MKCLLLIFFLAVFDDIQAQDAELDQYYLTDSIIRKNKVKKITYSNDEFPHLNGVLEYDSFGREIAEYHTNSEAKNKTRYIQHGDSIMKIRFALNRKNEIITHEIAKYVYNKKGAIVLYASCRQASDSNKMESNMARFNYDNKGRIIAAHYYSNNNYPFPFNSSYPIIDTLFNLSEIVEYEYNSSQLILKKQRLKKNNEFNIDSLFYDKKKYA